MRIMKNKLIFLFLTVSVLLSSPFASAAILQGTVYNDRLDVEKDVLVTINTVPEQKYVAKEGTYAFDLSPGSYVVTIKKGALETTENVNIISEGTFIVDLFLLPDFSTEDELWQDLDEDLLEGTGSEGTESPAPMEPWRYVVGGVIILYLVWRVLRMRKKYGSLRKFRKQVKEEQAKTIEQHKEEIAAEPGYLEETLEIIKKHDGRITQKALRREMLHLSEAKVSLIVTELEHKGKIEKMKKGRGNVIFLK